MKAADWKNVKVHQTLIYARDDVGVVRATVTEIDIKVEEFEPTFHYAYPWGKTATDGVVKIKYEVNAVSREHEENLANLIKFKSRYFTELTKAYNDWQQYHAAALAYREVFLSLNRQRIAE